MGRAPVLKYLVLDARGFLWLRPIMSGFKWCYFTRSWPWWCIPGIGEPSGMTTGGLGQATRRIYNGWVGGKILIVHGYCDEWEDPYKLFPGLILFRLVDPPLQSRVVGLYLVRGTWFPSRLLLEETDYI
jgi:hypothetical protein